MKRFFITLLALTFFVIPGAQAATPVIRIVDKPHTNFDGTFRDNELAASLLPNGKLGKLIYSTSSSRGTFVIDAALVDEVASMAKGYLFDGKKDLDGQKTAENWIFRLKYATAGRTVVTLPYGNPDERLLKSIAPGELQYYLKYAKLSLESVLGRPVVAERGWGSGSSRLGNQMKSDYRDNRRLLTGLSTITTSLEVSTTRARLAIFMNPLLSRKEQAFFSYREKIAVDALSNRLKVIPGRYQITSSSAKLPITLINNFETASVVSISFIPLNARISVENINNISIASRSRQQILVPVNVNVQGETLVLAQFVNSEGQPVGKISKLNITSTVIDSRVTWFTTSAAILLLLGAIAQSVRRFRRHRSLTSE